MADDDGLGLTLSLKCPENAHSNFMHFHNSFLNDQFNSIADRAAEARSFLRRIDENRPPAVVAGAGEEDVGGSSPNSTVSTSVSGVKRSEREEGEAEAEAEAEEKALSCRGMSDDDDVIEAAPKKLRLSKEQSAMLEDTFKEHKTLNTKQKSTLARQLNLRPRQVEVWFQNRRARTKLKQTEVECEQLKKCCENLTEENRRLQKEVNELRSLKLSPHLYMNITPPTTLTMCPSCERVASTSSSSPAVAPTARHLIPVGPSHQKAAVPFISWATMSMAMPNQPLGANNHS